MLFSLYQNLNLQPHTDYNADYSKRIAILPDKNAWSETGMSGIRYKLLESCCEPYPRRTLLLQCDPGSTIDQQGEQNELEFFVLRGEISDQNNNYPVSTYVRNPEGCSHAHSEQGCSVFIKLSQIHEEDQGQRIINTRRESKWLPGPSEGIQIYPLHVWDTESIFLIRWKLAAHFKPIMDPKGEEILVIEGELQDEFGRYPKGSWIRNPTAIWQSWVATAGTVVYYKNGHFPGL